MCATSCRATSSFDAFGSGCAPFVVEERDLVFVRADRILREIRRKQRQLLALALRFRVFGEFLAFGGEADAERRFRQTGDGGEDVRRRFELEREVAGGLLHLLLAHLRRPIVRDCRNAYEYVSFVDVPLDRRKHLFRRYDVDTLDSGRRRESARPRHDRDLGAGFARRPGDRESHFPGALVRQTSDHVDRFERRSGRHEHAHAGERLGREQGHDRFGDLGRFEHPAHADLAARLVAAPGAEDRHAVVSQLPNVALVRGVLPHLPVHRGCDGKRAFACQTERREQVVAEAVRDFREEVRGCRRDDDEGLVARERDVRHAVAHARIPHAGVDGLPRESLHGGGRDEPARRLRHHDVHFYLTFGETADELRTLVGGDSTGHAKQDLFSCSISHVATRGCRACAV